MLYSRTDSAPLCQDAPPGFRCLAGQIFLSMSEIQMQMQSLSHRCWEAGPGSVGSVGSVGMTECWEQPGLVMVILPPVSVLLVFSGSVRHLGTTGRTWWENDPSGGRHFCYLMPCRLSSSCIVKHSWWTCKPSVKEVFCCRVTLALLHG